MIKGSKICGISDLNTLNFIITNETNKLRWVRVIDYEI